MEQRLATFFSYVLHPSVLPLAGTALIFAVQPYQYSLRFAGITLLIVFCGTFLLPAVITMAMKQAGWIESIHMAMAKDRRWPFLAGSTFFLLTSRALASHPFPEELSRYLLGLGLAILMAVLVLPRIKVSAHMGSFGGLWALALHMAYAVGYASPLFLMALALLTGVAWWARKTLNAHTNGELWLGLLMGMTAVGLLLRT